MFSYFFIKIGGGGSMGIVFLKNFIPDCTLKEGYRNVTFFFFKKINMKMDYYSGYTNHSGGAFGADIMWDIIGKEFGMVKNNHYWLEDKTPHGNIEITEYDKIEGQQKVTIAARQMGRIEPHHHIKDNRLIRNWSQVKYSEAIFAISTILKVGDEMNYGKKALILQAKGGTGYAVQMAINERKPVYLYDQVRKLWTSNINGVWSRCGIPELTKEFAGIGTRNVNIDGEAEIRKVYRHKILKEMFN